MIRPRQVKPAVPLGATRRRFVQVAGAGLATLLGAPLCQGGEEQAKSSRVLKRDDKIDIHGKGEEIIQKAYELGHRYEKEHGG